MHAEDRPVPSPRRHFLGEDGKIKSADNFEAPTDSAALEAAEQMLAGSKYPQIEVWERARRLGAVTCS
jgi:hypothetical protein